MELSTNSVEEKSQLQGAQSETSRSLSMANNDGDSVSNSAEKEKEGSAKVSATEVEQDNEDSKTNLRILQLEDATLDQLPKHTENILSQLDLRRASQTDLLIALIYCIAVENGFVSKAINQSDLHAPIWACTFHSKNVIKASIAAKEPFYSSPIDNFYRLDLQLPAYSDKTITMGIIRTGEFLLITLTPDADLPGYSVCLSIQRFVLSNKTREILRNFRNLKELAFLLRERIFVPARNSIIDDGTNSFPGLPGLPTELILHIIKQMRIRDLQNLSKTCSRLRVECETEYARRPKKETPRQMRIEQDLILYHFQL